MKAFPGLGLRAKILILVLGCTLLALGLQTWFFQTSASSLIFQLEEEASRKSLGRMQDELYSWLKGYENNLISIYNQGELMRDLARSPATAALRGKNSRAAYTLMQSVFEPAQAVDALYLYTLDHRLVSYSRVASTPRYNFPEDIYRNPQESRADEVSRYVASDDRVMLVTSSYNASRQQTIVRLVLKLYTNNVRTKIGFLVCDIDPKGFLRIVDKYAYSDRQVVWLQPAGDNPVLVSGRHEGRTGAEFDKAVAGIRASTWTQAGAGPIRNHVFLSTPQVKYDLTAYSLVPQELLEESQGVLTRNMAITALLVVLVALLSASLITRSLTTPLTGIVRSLGRIKDGETSLRLEGLKFDEIGVLGRSINDMLDRIQELITLEYDAELQLKHAEYKALQAQVNPHFLYNTLDTMSSIATAQQTPLVASLCQAMSNLFRYSLDMKDPLSTVGEEIRHLKNYLYVMNVRTDHSIEVDIDIERVLLSEKVPRLSLQPLVENSINHGLKNKRGAKKVRIHAQREGEAVKLSVWDNGVGLDVDQVNRLLVASPRIVTQKNASIGLGNIHARIGLLFGPQFGVGAASDPLTGTTVWVTVPKIPSTGGAS